jgi:hypothetical protein
MTDRSPAETRTVRLKREGPGSYSFTAPDGTRYHVSQDEDFDAYKGASGWEMSVTNPTGVVAAWYQFGSLGEARRWLTAHQFDGESDA